MISSEQYIDQTEHAVKSMFESIDYYRGLIGMSIPPVAVFRHNGKEGEFEKKYEEWRSRPEVRQEFEVAKYAREEYQASLFSMHVISGSILQIAFKGIELHAINSKFDDFLLYLCHGCNGEKSKSNAINIIKKFAFGRVVRGVPLGLVIYAGRNQYNHFDDKSGLRIISRNIFKALATNHDYGDFNDPAFDLERESITSYSSNICSILGWNSYQKYAVDIRSLLSNECHI